MQAAVGLDQLVVTKQEKEAAPPSQLADVLLQPPILGANHEHPLSTQDYVPSREVVAISTGSEAVH